MWVWGGWCALGYIAFSAVGAYVYALLASPHFNVHWPFWVILPLGALAVWLEPYRRRRVLAFLNPWEKPPRINYPILPFRLYAPDLFKRGAIDDKVESRGTLHSEPALGFKRLALHSRAISFIQPSTGKRVVVEAPYPDDFKEAVEQFS